MKIKNEKAISLRLPNNLYKKFVDIALKKGKEEHRIISVSEVIRKILNENFK
jgi:hypothetical protein